MSGVVRSARFGEDLLTAARWYADEASLEVADRFIDAVEVAVRSAAARPGLGSLRGAEIAGIAGLRSRPVAGFPSLLFFVRRPDQSVVLVRLLHGRRDLPATLRETD